MVKRTMQKNGFLKRMLFLVLVPALCAVAGHIFSPSAYASPWANPLNITIWVGYPVDAAQAALIQACVDDASLWLWDASDGQFRLGTVTLTASVALKSSADIWLLPEDGRAGLSFYGDGTALESASHHIVMFQNSLDGHVLAHELGHYALGLGDEYREGWAVGNNCAVPGRRIGTCAGLASAPSNPTYCLMQENANGSEFCVAANHDPQMGNLATMDLADYNPAYITSWSDMDLTLADVGLHNWFKHADDFWCLKAYDAVTGNYEATQQSGIHYRVTTDNSTTPATHTRVPLSCWETIHLNRPSLAAPAGNPVDAPPAAPPAVNFVNNVTAADKVLLVMDRSGSMGWSVVTPGREVCGNGADDDSDGTTDEGDCDTEKLAYAKAAARAFIDLYSTTGTNQAGLHSFSSWAGENRALAVIQAQNCPADAGTNTCMLKNSVEDLSAGGSTDIYEALQLAYNTLSPLAGTRAVFMLTDGCHNNPGDPADWVDDYAAAGIPVFTITVGTDVNQELINDITSSTSGEHIAVQSASDLQAAYAEMTAYLKGDGIILPRTAGMVSEKPRTVAAGQAAAGTGNSISYPLQVTSGAQRLTVFIGNTKARVANLDARLTLTSPSGTAYGESAMPPGARFVRDPFYLFAVIENPQAGTWSVNVRGTGAVQPFQILAFEFQPQVSFRGSVKPAVVTPGKPVDLTAVPAYFRDLYGKKVALTYEVERPDGSLVSGKLKWHEHLNLWRDGFDRFAGPGLYKVRFTAKVEAGAQLVEGESIFGAPSRPVRVPSFVRHYTTAFFVVGDERSDPLPGGDGTVTRPGGKIGLSFHVGSAHPLGGWNSQHDANSHFHFDLNYALLDNVRLLLLAGINQFTADWSSGLDNRYWHYFALNAQWRFYQSSWLSWYLQGGPGWYLPKTGSAKAGFIAGLGARLPLGIPVVLECGFDYHFISGKEKTKFFVTQLGVVFDLARARRLAVRR